MARYFAPISVADLQSKIKAVLDHDSEGDQDFCELLNHLKGDIKVQFDTENFDLGGGDSFGPNGLMGCRKLSNGLTFWGMAAGGDWEVPVFFIVYWDGKKLRGYVPTDGNPWNTTTKEAYGNNDLADMKNVKKRWPVKFRDWKVDEDSRDDWTGHLDFDSEELQRDILARIVKK